MARGELCILRDDAKRLLAGNGFFPQLIPALVKFAFVLVGPLLGHMVGGVCRARREVDEEGLVRSSAFCCDTHAMALSVMSSMK